MAFDLRLGCNYRLDGDGTTYTGIDAYFGVNNINASEFNGVSAQKLQSYETYAYFYNVVDTYLKVYAPTIPSGWYFKSWKAEILSSSGGSVIGTFTSNTNPSGADGSIDTGWDLSSYLSCTSGTITVYVNFTLYVTTQRTYIVSFDLNGGTGDFDSIATNTGSAVLPTSTPTREGYTFLGWSEDSGSSTAEYSPGQTISVNSDTILFAIWSKIPTPPSSGDGSLVYNPDDSLLIYVSDGSLAHN